MARDEEHRNARLPAVAAAAPGLAPGPKYTFSTMHACVVISTCFSPFVLHLLAISYFITCH
jgi:hypothetical protein